MRVINEIEIKYFRSVYHSKIKDIKSLSIFSGKNDAGKSNVLKALNLFFNNQTDWQQELDFYKDFNVERHAYVTKDTVKGKQYIQISISFNRGDRCVNSLPEKFTVTKTWHRDSILPDMKSDHEDKMGSLTEKQKTYARMGLSRFLNSLKYEYVPAIKDERIFGHILSNLQDTLIDMSATQEQDLGEGLKRVNTQINEFAVNLGDEFESACGIKTRISLPSSLVNLYRAFFVHTGYGKKGEHNILLDQRGDGIRVRFLPSILNYVSHMSKRHYIWGFEEPENSLEYALANKMAFDFKNTYASYAQIFLTSHSPAFFSLNGSRVNIYRVFNKDFRTSCTILGDAKEIPELSEELGVSQLQQELHETYLKKLERMNLISQEVIKLKEIITESQKPLVLTEGKTDVAILKTAWQKLFPEKLIPFNIQSCDLYPPEEKGTSGAGCGILAKTLQCIRFDNPHLIIGLFDRDTEGIKAYKLDNNFLSYNRSTFIKKHRNGKAYAILLPTPDGMENFEEVENLPIEFYFSEGDLNKEVEGKKLKLVFNSLELKYNGKTIRTEQRKELRFAQIDRQTKVDFAENVVPTLSAEAFERFQLLFENIHLIIGADAEG